MKRLTFIDMLELAQEQDSISPPLTKEEFAAVVAEYERQNSANAEELQKDSGASAPSLGL